MQDELKIEIIPPEGYEIDIVKSHLGKYIFRKIDDYPLLKERVVLHYISEYDFSDGTQVSKDTINSWRNDILKTFSKDAEIEVSSIRSGNSLVIGRRNKETGRITIFEIDSGYKEITYKEEKEKA